MNLNLELSDYIRLSRLKKRMSQEDASIKLSVSRNTYNKWETNPIKLDLDTLIKIGAVLDIDILIFFNQYVAKCKDKNE